MTSCLRPFYYMLNIFHISCSDTKKYFVYYKLKSGVRFEVCTAVIMKNVVFWNIEPSSYFTGDTLRLRYRAQPVNAM
jgi:hypothetical protein